jgi:hypothetical protein
MESQNRESELELFYPNYRTHPINCYNHLLEMKLGHLNHVSDRM